MAGNHSMQSRRGALMTLAAMGAVVPLAARAQTRPPFRMPDTTDGVGDWDWLVGRWKVSHHRLKERLAGSTEWEDFAGESSLWLTLGGFGTIDDNLIELPGGTYRAMGIRAFDTTTRKWSIWWLDARKQTIDPPVRGGFRRGIGTFVGEDTLRGKPVLVRFEWSKITPTTAHWEQAFSPDGGSTWEVNWRMDFSRIA